MQKSSFVERLQKIQQSKNLSRKELSALSGVSVQCLSDYFTEKKQPSIETLTMLARALNVSADYLLGLSDIPSQDESIKSINKKTGLSEYAIKHLMLWKYYNAPNLAALINHLLENNNYSIYSVLNLISYRDTLEKCRKEGKTDHLHAHLPQGISSLELTQYMIDKDVRAIFDSLSFAGNESFTPDILDDAYSRGSIDNLIAELFGGEQSGKHSGTPR